MIANCRTFQRLQCKKTILNPNVRKTVILHQSTVAAQNTTIPIIPKYLPSAGVYKAPKKKHYKTIVVGGGHNGLVAAAYLAKSGKQKNCRMGEKMVLHR